MIERKYGYYEQGNYAVITKKGNKPIPQEIEINEEDAEKTLKCLKQKAWNDLKEAKRKYKKTADKILLKRIKVIKNNIKTIQIIEYKKLEKALIKYTQKTPVYETDLIWFDFVESQGEPEDVEIKVFENRFEVMIDSRYYPTYRQVLYLHDKKNDKYYMSEKLHMNPRKWHFDFDNEKIKAPFKKSYIEYKEGNMNMIAPTL